MPIRPYALDDVGGRRCFGIFGECSSVGSAVVVGFSRPTGVAVLCWCWLLSIVLSSSDDCFSVVCDGDGWWFGWFEWEGRSSIVSDALCELGSLIQDKVSPVTSLDLNRMCDFVHLWWCEYLISNNTNKNLTLNTAAQNTLRGNKFKNQNLGRKEGNQKREFDFFGYNFAAFSLF